MKHLHKLIGFAIFAIFLGCGGGGGGGGGGSTDKPVDVVLVDGYIINATMSDGNNTPVRYQKENKVYHFYDTPKEYIKVSGGTFEESGLENKMSYNVPPTTKVISPIVQFLQQFPDLKKPLAQALKVGEDALLGDFVKDKKLDIAKLAQVIYAMNIHGLSGKFATEVKDVTNVSDILLSAIASASGHSKESEIKSFIFALKNQTDTLTLEQDIYQQKKIMQQNVTIAPPPSNNPSNPTSNSLSVASVTPEGNLHVKVAFSEKVQVATSAQKGAFTLRQIVKSNIKLDGNQSITVGARSVTLPLKSAIETENANHTYNVKVATSFVSSTGLILGEKEAVVDVAPSQLALQKVLYVDSKTIKASFNLPLDSSTLSQNDFTVKGTVSYVASNVTLDPQDDKTIIITLGNTIASNAGYELIVQMEKLASKSGAIKLTSVAKKEFTSTVATQPNLNEGFNLLNASVNKEQNSILLNFSKDIMSLPSKDMFSIRLDALQDPLELNITDNNGTSKMVNIKPASTLLSPENNNTAYELSIAKQTIFSTDGARTFGATYKKIFQVTNYPKVTSAALSGSSISVKFNIPMDLNASFVSVTQGGSETNVNVSGSGTSYSIADANGSDFNSSSTTLTIKQGVQSSDKKSVLDMDFVKDFNSSN